MPALPNTRKNAIASQQSQVSITFFKAAATGHGRLLTEISAN